MDILTMQKGASLAMPEQQSNRITSPRGGVVLVVLVVILAHIHCASANNALKHLLKVCQVSSPLLVITK